MVVGMEDSLPIWKFCLKSKHLIYNTIKFSFINQFEVRVVHFWNNFKSSITYCECLVDWHSCVRIYWVRQLPKSLLFHHRICCHRIPIRVCVMIRVRVIFFLISLYATPNFSIEIICDDRLSVTCLRPCTSKILGSVLLSDSSF